MTLPTDDDLAHFAAHGAPALPPADDSGHVEHDCARIAYTSHGSAGDPAVILLHGGLGHGDNWGYQVPALVAAGYRAVTIDSRGHGRSTRDARPYSYDLLAADVRAVMDALGIGRAALVGWSDGACTALVLARRAPQRVAGVLFFACNMDASGAKPFVATPRIDRCFARHRQDYRERSATPDAFDAFVAAVSEMQRTQPEYSRADLAEIDVPVLVMQSAEDEFIRWEHADHLAQTLPHAELVQLRDVTHFAPLQRPDDFNRVMLGFIARVLQMER